jgi:multidrug efflux pump subunit AcrA (membrane-fusion protein)
MRDTFEAGGVVAARTTAAVASRIVATVVAVSVAPGQRVRAGQPLILLDGRELESKREQASAALRALERSAAAVAAERDAAEATRALAQATHDRVAALHARRSATPQELDEAVAAFRGAEARAQAAHARVAEVDAGLDAARAGLAAAATAASFAVLTAPFDGTVTETLTEPGNLAVIGVPLLRVDGTRGYRLEVRVDESHAAALKLGDPVHVALRTPDGSEEADDAAGRISEIARAVDAANHAFLVKIDLPALPHLRSGLFARARFSRAARSVLTVPDAALLRYGQLTSVFVVTERQRARMRAVRIGQSDQGFVEIVAGVAAGEEVIVAPPPALRDGDSVRPASPTTTIGDR